MNKIQARYPAPQWPPPPPDPILDPDIIAGYLQDASRMVGNASALYRPASELELAATLHHLNKSGTPVTVVAKQTSTTGSSVPLGGAIVSMEKLNGVLAISGESKTACAQGGIILGEFQREIERQGLFYPPDPTSRDESTLGASVACNASGARTFKYGPTRPYVRRLRVVLAEGFVLDVTRGEVQADDEGVIWLDLPDGTSRRCVCPQYARPNVKHAAGYHSGARLDLVDLFIGSEGTLGVISEVEVCLLEKAERVLGFLATWPSEDAALAFVQAARDRRTPGGFDPRCLEWFDTNALKYIARFDSSHPLPPEAGAAVFFEQECTETNEDTLLEAWYELLMETGALVEAENGVIVAETAARQQYLYDLRHSVPAGVNEVAAHNQMPKLGTDLAVPDEALEAMMRAYSEAMNDVPGALGSARCLEIMREVVAEEADAEARRAALDALHALDGLDALHAHNGLDAFHALPESERRFDDPWDALVLPRRFDYAIFGHIGNNHVHVNMLPTTSRGLLVARRVYEALTEKAIGLGGTVSAEHGIGKLKRGALRKLLGDEAILQMRAVKRVFDPGSILCRGNLFEG